MRALSLLREDIETVLRHDPAVHSRWEALLYPHLAALWGYRMAHALHRASLPTTARLVSLTARLVSGGVDIHPAAQLGRRVFLDHPTGVVIGATAVIGDDVTFFQDVTIGARSNGRDRDDSGERRHPVIEDGVVIGAKASVLGRIVVGKGAHIGAHSLVLDDVPAGTRVRAAVASPVSTDR